MDNNEIINPQDKDYYDGQLWKVSIWPGAGYLMDEFVMYAGNAEEALNIAVVDAELNTPGILMSIDEVEEHIATTFDTEYQEFREENSDADTFTFATEYLNYVYVDATMEGASQPYFIMGENLKIEEVSDKKEEARASKNELSTNFKEEDNLWISGTCNYMGTEYEVSAKVYMQGSEFGINNSAVSKLTVGIPTKDGYDKPTFKAVVNYDRGWDVEPEDDTIKQLVDLLVPALEHFRQNHPFESNSNTTENKETKTEELSDKWKEKLGDNVNDYPEYEFRALRFAEIYGIVDYGVVGNTMVYTEKHKDNGFNEKPVTYKHTVNLDTMKETVSELEEAKQCIKEDEDVWQYDENESAFENLFGAVCSGDGDAINYIKNYYNKNLGKVNTRYQAFGYDISLIMAALRNKNYEVVDLLKSFGEKIRVDEVPEYKNIMAQRTYEDDVTKSALEEEKTREEAMQETINHLIDEIAKNLDIDKSDITVKDDTIVFHYNGDRYVAEPRSVYQVDVYDENNERIGYGTAVNKLKEELFTEYEKSINMEYQLVGGEYAGTYTYEEVTKLPIYNGDDPTDYDEYRNNGGFVHRKELDNQPILEGYLGPMWNGINNGKACIRYETPEVYDRLSENKTTKGKSKKIKTESVKDESLLDDVMKYLYEDYISDGTINNYIDDDSELVGLIEEYTYIGSLVDLPADEEDMEDEEIAELPQVQELLNDMKSKIAELQDVKYYNEDIELSDRAILSEVTYNETAENIDPDELMQIYWQEADRYLDEFEQDNNIDKGDLGYDGRGQRHIVLKDKYKYAKRYNELVDACNKMQDDFIDYIDNYNYSGEKIEENKEVKTESKTWYVAEEIYDDTKNEYKWKVEKSFKSKEDAKKYYDSKGYSSSKDNFAIIDNSHNNIVKENKEVKTESWFGLEGAKFIYKGDWSDPLVSYRGYIYDYYDIEEYVLSDMNSEYEELGKELPAENTKEYDDLFNEYMENDVENALYDLQPMRLDPNVMEFLENGIIANGVVDLIKSASKVAKNMTFEGLIARLETLKEITDIPEDKINEAIKTTKDIYDSVDKEDSYDEDERYEEVIPIISDILSNVDDLYESKQSKKNKEVKTEDVETTETVSEDLNTGVLPVVNVDMYSMSDFLNEFDIDDNSKLDEIVMEIAPEYIAKTVKEVLPSAQVKATSMYHPKQYNFSGDELEFTLSFDKAEYEALKEKALADDNFNKYLKDTYSTSSGYISLMADNKEDFERQDNWKQVVQVIMFNIPESTIYDNNEEYLNDFTDKVSENFLRIEDESKEVKTETSNEYETERNPEAEETLRFEYKGISVSYNSETNVINFYDKETEEDIDSIYYRNQTVEELKKYIDTELLPQSKKEVKTEDIDKSETPVVEVNTQNYDELQSTHLQNFANSYTDNGYKEVGSLEDYIEPYIDLEYYDMDTVFGLYDDVEPYEKYIPELSKFKNEEDYGRLDTDEEKEASELITDWLKDLLKAAIDRGDLKIVDKQTEDHKSKINEDELEKLAMDLTDYSAGVDPYEFQDAGKDYEEAFEEAIKSLSTPEGRESLIKVLEVDVEETEDLSDEERRVIFGDTKPEDLIKRIKALGNSLIESKKITETKEVKTESKELEYVKNYNITNGGYSNNADTVYGELKDGTYFVYYPEMDQVDIYDCPVDELLEILYYDENEMSEEEYQDEYNAFFENHNEDTLFEGPVYDEIHNLYFKEKTESKEVKIESKEPIYEITTEDGRKFKVTNCVYDDNRDRYCFQDVFDNGEVGKMVHTMSVKTWKTRKLIEAKSSYEQQFVDYCEGKVDDLGTIEVANPDYFDEDDDELIPAQVLMTAEEFREFEDVKVIARDDMEMDDWENVVIADSNNNVVIDGDMISVIEYALRMEFNKIDTSFYNEILEYWDEGNYDEYFED